MWKESGNVIKQRAAGNIFCRAVENEMFTFFTETAIRNGYTDREKQYDMSEEVLQAIREHDHLLVEAGVGIGKTFAYLVPVLLYSVTAHAPVAIATSTIALQEQLKGDVEEVARMLGTNVEAVIAKGQTHYICTKKAREYMGPGAKDIKELLKLGRTERSEYDVDDTIWEKVRVERYSRECSRKCDKPCGYHIMRSKLLTSQVTICNQNLLTMHLLQLMDYGSPILNKHIKIIIIDEAHNLESKVRECTQVELQRGAIISKIKKSLNCLHGAARDLAAPKADAAISVIEDFFFDIRSQMNHQDRKSSSEIDRYFYRKNWNLLSAMQEAIDAYYEKLEIYLSMDNTPADADDLQKYSRALEDLIDTPHRYVVWIEKNGIFCICRENIRDIVQQIYFDGEPVCILTSATLTGTSEGSLEDQYAYMSGSLGFTGLLAEPKESPFDYDRHAMIFVADKLPHPTKKHGEFIIQGTKLLKDILDISEGRALVLFTSKKDMLEVYGELQDSPYEILMQKQGASQQETLDLFRDNEHAVLLGTGAYWEGINIEGKTLSNVIIFRLPFPVPDPILQSREKHSENPLMEIKVPEMVIKLKQGVGRLIRSESDKGIISIIDSRIGESSTAPYKEIVWNALPIRNRTGNLDEIRKFYRDVVLGE